MAKDFRAKVTAELDTAEAEGKLNASLREATGAYQNWLDKQNASESGDMFDDAMGALQHIEDTTQNTDSEYYGRTGREDYKANHRYIGTMNKNGVRTGQDWYYEHAIEVAYNKHITMHKIMSEHFGKNEFGSEETEVHHIRKNLRYKPNDGNVCNRAENLQLLPKEIHKELTRYASKTNAELDKELKQKVKEADCPMYAYTPEMLEAVIKWNIQNCLANGLQPVIYMTSITDDAAEIEAEAHPLKIEK